MENEMKDCSAGCFWGLSCCGFARFSRPSPKFSLHRRNQGHASRASSIETKSQTLKNTLVSLAVLPILATPGPVFGEKGTPELIQLKWDQSPHRTTHAKWAQLKNRKKYKLA